METLWEKYRGFATTSLDMAQDSSSLKDIETLRKAKSPLGFVKNQDGQDLGIVTVEDILRKYLGKVDF